VSTARFEWDDAKDRENIAKHDVSFSVAQLAFADPRRIITFDDRHSADEERFFCFGRVEEHVLTVRFTHRDGIIRLIGAGRWRKGRRLYEKTNAGSGHADRQVDDHSGFPPSA